MTLGLNETFADFSFNNTVIKDFTQEKIRGDINWK